MAKRGRKRKDLLDGLLDDAITTYFVKHEKKRKSGATGQPALIRDAQRTIAAKLKVKPRNVREAFQKSEKLRKAIRTAADWEPEGEPVPPNETPEQRQARLRREVERERRATNAK